LSILERLLVIARGDGKSYIYAKFYPKYGTVCLPTKDLDGEKRTPAQTLGITKKYLSKKYNLFKISEKPSSAFLIY